MNLVEAIVVFCWGLTVVILVGRGLRSQQTPQVRIFTGVTAAVIGAGALVLLGSLLNHANAWPEEFWAYPIGLLVGLPVCVAFWDESERSSREYQFKLSIGTLMTASVILLWLPGLVKFFSPETAYPDVLREITRSLGEALLIAAVLAVTVDAYIKRRTYQEISLDVFKFLIGYALPDEFKHHIRELVTNSDLLRRDSTIFWNLHPEGAEGIAFQLDARIIYVLQNISNRRSPYQFQTGKSPGEDQETRLIRLWGNFPNDDDSYNWIAAQVTPSEPDASGRQWILGRKVEVEAENVQHGLHYKAGADYESHLRRQFDYHVFAKPTLGATVTVEHPADFVVTLSPSSDGRVEVHPAGPGRVQSIWTFRRLFTNEDAIFVRWTKRTEAASDGDGGTSNVTRG